MDRPFASYFISIQGDAKTLDKAEQYLRDSRIVPDYLSIPDKSAKDLFFEVPDGSIPRWDDVDKVFAEMSKVFPSLSIVVNENCEEPIFPSRTITFSAGEAEEHFGRILSPEDFDGVTINKLAAALRANDMDDAADFIIGLKLA